MAQKDVDRYMAAMHAMQTGVMWQMQDPSVKETEPKHLRVGVNSALIDSGALARVLIKKGIITMDDWEVALADLAEEEVADYTRRVRTQVGTHITLA